MSVSLEPTLKHIYFSKNNDHHLSQIPTTSSAASMSSTFSSVNPSSVLNSVLSSLHKWQRHLCCNSKIMWMRWPGKYDASVNNLPTKRQSIDLLLFRAKHPPSNCSHLLAFVRWHTLSCTTSKPLIYCTVQHNHYSQSPSSCSHRILGAADEENTVMSCFCRLRIE